MTLGLVLAPVFLQVLLVFIVAGVMGLRRFKAIRSQNVKSSALVGDDRAWPKTALLAANAFRNQFEIPVLFYLLMIVAVITKQADTILIALAFVFVATRYVHAYIHVTTNRMPQRFYAYITGVAVLLVMWILFGAKIYSAT